MLFRFGNPEARGPMWQDYEIWRFVTKMGDDMIEGNAAFLECRREVMIFVQLSVLKCESERDGSRKSKPGVENVSPKVGL